ncbi:hypothetical protein BDF20DRAFT_863500 [Mycotypha africana]|uniref:uncharacterized protein n=1 Tax=Mycotypha africana TaxID=64632 RepID=UPI002300091D|nr:uncharacterized protein BDF20DRAFT_863500 [Mycotypha africana]KAI8981833.1 hypothetical protein BDF20DRAFT_863500 [Mycotypha africana]
MSQHQQKEPMYVPQTALENLSLNDKPIRVVCGPLLRYLEIDYNQRLWRGSCLIVLNHFQAPKMKIRMRPTAAAYVPERSIEPTAVDTLDIYRNEYHFWRYDLQLPLITEEQIVTYTFNCFNDKEFQFYVPSIQNSMRFMFYSCSGFSDIPQAIKDKFNEKEAPLWQDVLDRHQVMPFHVMLGGGDQLYQDRLIHEDFMKPWVAEKNPKKRLAMTLPQSMRDGFEEFYFWNYVKCFGFKESPVQAQAYASIPAINMWDDHDIIDGYGSYPADMQSADCFKVLFANASRFYYLFQHHTTIERAERDGMIRGSQPTCHHIVTTLGPDIGLLSLDARGERSKFEICTKKSYDACFKAMYERLPFTIKHFMVLTGVPLIYPRLTLFENLMEGAANLSLATVAGKTGTLGDIIDGQLNEWNGDPELLDDMNDHWTAGNHELERREFIKRLQSYATEKSVRISFLGGDVHCCAAGRLYSKDMKDKEEGDPYLMVQIVSSAIVNVPPPQVLLTVLNQKSTYVTFDGNIEERMYNLFKSSPNGNTRKNKKLMGRRNYCAGYFDEGTGKLNFWIQAEVDIGKKGTRGYLVDVPKLVFGQAGVTLHTKVTKDHLLKQNILASDVKQHQHFHFHRHPYQTPPQFPPSTYTVMVPPPVPPHVQNNSEYHNHQRPTQQYDCLNMGSVGGFIKPPPK